VKVSSGKVFHHIVVRHIPTGISVGRLEDHDYNVVRLHVYNALKKVVEADEAKDNQRQLTG
jgi:hypothetical protein